VPLKGGGKKRRKIVGPGLMEGGNKPRRVVREGLSTRSKKKRRDFQGREQALKLGGGQKRGIGAGFDEV